MSVINPMDLWCIRLTNHYFNALIEPPTRQQTRDLANVINRGRRRQKQFFFCAKCDRLRPARTAQSYDEHLRGVPRGEATWRDAVCVDCRRTPMHVPEPERVEPNLKAGTEPPRYSSPKHDEGGKGFKRRVRSWWTGMKGRARQVKGQLAKLQFES